jgi:NAD(P)-dependent dehydrogenase (short-subunit alcohol dehydrogenase family)
MAYRMAKAALNSQTVTLAHELQKLQEPIAVIALYPGFVATKLTGFDFDDDMATCIAGMMEVILKCDIRDTGVFIAWNGERIPW